MSSTPHHQVTFAPPYEGPLLGLGGVRGPAGPVVPPRRRGVVRDLHHLRLQNAGGRRRSCCLRRRLHSRLRGRGRRMRRHGHHLWPRLRSHGRRGLLPLRLLHSDSPCGLRLHHCRCRGLRPHDGRRWPLLSDRRPRRGGLICWPKPRGPDRTLRALARRRHACPRPRRLRRAPPGGDGRFRPQHLGRCERRHGWHHPTQARTEG
jgi:hypothetical protein